MAPVARPAMMVVPVSTLRRSSLSESRPIGHCMMTPPTMVSAMKKEISATPSPAVPAKTAPMPKKALWLSPTPNMPTKPKGEVR